MTILHRILDLYNAQDEKTLYKKALCLLLQNLGKVEDSSIETLAEICQVSPATMNRLVSKLGVSSFKQFKSEVAAIYNNYSRHNRCYPYSSSKESQTPSNFFEYFHERLNTLNRTYDSALGKNICNALHSKKRVIIYTDSCITHAKRLLQLDLFSEGKQVDFCSSMNGLIEAVNASPDPFFILCDRYIFYTNLSKGVEYLKQIRAHGCNVCLIIPTSLPINPDDYDFVMSFQPSNTSLDNYQVDILINLLTMQYRDAFIDE